MLAMKYIEIKKYTYKNTSTILFLYENNFKYIKNNLYKSKIKTDRGTHNE